MFLMLAEVIRLWTLHAAFPASRLWAVVAYNTTHVPWQGCSLHDLIQPAFSFLAGASLPFSIASRRARGESFTRLFGHAVWRSVALIFLGIFLRSLESGRTYWTFEDTLTQIGLGYAVLFLLTLAPLRVQIVAFLAILVGICPIVKRIWTSSYTLYSGGLVVLMLAGFHALIVWRGWTRWSFPLLVIGANSIAVYVMSWTMELFVTSGLLRHLGTAPFAVFGPPFESVPRGLGVLTVFWSILYWMHRRRIFLRI